MRRAPWLVGLLWSGVAWADPASVPVVPLGWQVGRVRPPNEELPDTMPDLRWSRRPWLLAEPPLDAVAWPIEQVRSTTEVVVVVQVGAPAEPEPAIDGPDRTGADGLWVCPPRRCGSLRGS